MADELKKQQKKEEKELKLLEKQKIRKKKL